MSSFFSLYSVIVQGSVVLVSQLAIWHIPLTKFPEHSAVDANLFCFSLQYVLHLVGVWVWLWLSFRTFRLEELFVDLIFIIYPNEFWTDSHPHSIKSYELTTFLSSTIQNRRIISSSRRTDFIYVGSDFITIPKSSLWLLSMLEISRPCLFNILVALYSNQNFLEHFVTFWFFHAFLSQRWGNPSVLSSIMSRTRKYIIN